MKYKTKFTKKEILVVLCCAVFLLLNIGAIGSGGRRIAKDLVCLSNLHNWSAIFENYTNENNDKFFTGQTAQGFLWIAQLEELYQSYKQNPLWFCPMAKKPIIDEYGFYSQTLNIFNAWGIYTRSVYNNLCRDGIAGSYGLNGYVLNVDPGVSFQGGRRTDDNWRTFNVKDASDVPIFMEALRFDLWPLETDPPADSEFAVWQGTNHMARCCINRHNGAINCLFMDWSARKVGLKELWTLKWHRTFNTEGPWTKAGGVRPSDWPAWMKNFKEY